MPARNSVGIGIAVACLIVGSASARPYPESPVHLVVGYGAGGGTDLVARALAPELSKALGTSVIVDNKPGAGGSIGAAFVARARPDGYTVLVSSASAVTITPLINPGVGYTRASFAPVTQLSIAPLVVAVSKDLGVHSVAELIAKAKAAPGKLNYASSGIGSGPHLAGVLFDGVTGVNLTHVPFRSGAPATLSVISGETQVTFATTPSVMPQVRAGQLIGLAVSTQASSPVVPELPGMAAAGLPGYEIFQWNGLFVPKGTSAEIMEKLFDAAKKALASPAVKTLLLTEGTDVAVSETPAAFGAFLDKDEAFWRDLVKKGGVTAVE